MNAPTATVPDAEDAEFDAMRAVFLALKGLDVAAQNRVLDYVCRRLSLSRVSAEARESEPETHARPDQGPTVDEVRDVGTEGGDLEGISPIARKWMRRSGLTSNQLSSLFSLGVEDIDLVTTSVPGKSHAQRVRSVMLLNGIASYLGSGVARVSDEKLREACGHYEAYDPTNFAKHVKALAPEASGSKETGYTLTSRGITAATDLIKKIVDQQIGEG